ncbi:SusD/RagB family nutrient-binding outer membrane lipoprotein [Carboxylicivirga linearis]|uniref:SusD/RagB family nutrient-binding outer membrane lipoprotein n=1 Tax=Carboxylicivirga linearis TaxID=1628157 RepID=A0ABS5JSF3_9BACT|nr:SusD/RagB family nutrient-binding outer membrane lipoprotein [Carboxylicivirga linearis]MBS2097316.1 SusD/RagB family nutrient-binding outer membrane lipoprotein [Carboxylicivirga linearis]
MKKILFLFIISLGVWGCSDLDELNIDTKNPSAVPGEPLFTNGTRNMFDMMADVNVNRNVFKLYSQYWAQTTYPDESQYNMVTRKNPDNWWRALYRDVLKDLDESKKIIETFEPVYPGETEMKDNKLAIISVMEVYTYSVLVDLFGDVPRTEALDPENVLPVYDQAEDVYDAIIVELNDAIQTLDADYAGFSSEEDPIYGGDVAGWVMFANSLKMRLALRIADVDASKAETMVLEAAPNLISSNDEACAITYFTSPPNTNPMWTDLVQSGRKDFVPANTVVDIMNDLEDPRRAFWFTEYEGGYVGGVYGTANSYTSFSHLGDPFLQPDLKGTVLNYAEVEFMLAEAVERGFAVSGTAEEHYNAGIEASILEWGGTTEDYTTYIANADVAYSTASGDWRQKIGIQKWLSLFNQGFDGWCTWRQFDFTGLTPPPGMAMSDIPTRFIYPISEPELNGSNYDIAAARYNDDSPTAKIFWDVN